MRGGISYVSKRYIKANNENYPDYDKEKPEIYINYLDLNNLYGSAMSQCLPFGGFKWVKTTNETLNGIPNQKDNSFHGYFWEVDPDYPKNLHEEQSDYPMAPGRIKIKTEWLSSYSLENVNKFDIKTGNINKLAPNLMPKNHWHIIEI